VPAGRAILFLLLGCPKSMLVGKRHESDGKQMRVHACGQQLSGATLDPRLASSRVLEAGHLNNDLAGLLCGKMRRDAPLPRAQALDQAVYGTLWSFFAISKRLRSHPPDAHTVTDARKLCPPYGAPHDGQTDADMLEEREFHRSRCLAALRAARRVGVDSSSSVQSCPPL
jgi:hypothetical protein